jgi:hypothetical protein
MLSGECSSLCTGRWRLCWSLRRPMPSWSTHSRSGLLPESWKFTPGIYFKSYAALFWATPHPMTPHPTELRSTLLSYAASYCACCILWRCRCTRVSPFRLKNFSLISEIKRIWIRFTCVSLFHYKISLLFFRFFSLIFASNFSLRFTGVIFASKRNKAKRNSSLFFRFFHFFSLFITFFRYFSHFFSFFSL